MLLAIMIPVCAVLFLAGLAALFFLPPDDAQIGCHRMDADELMRDYEDEAIELANS